MKNKRNKRKEITLKINDKEVTVPSGSTVLEAVRSADIYVPTLCYHPLLTAVGACRLCIVQIEGMKGFPTSCTTPATEGMLVLTDTEELREMRRGVLSFILSDHPSACLICSLSKECEEYQLCIRKSGVTTGCKFCPKDKRCELQKVVEYVGLNDIKLQFLTKGLEVEKDDPFFERDYNLCILCGRCVRVCDEIRGANVLSFKYRGLETVVGTAYEKSHLDAGCEFCGACVDVCPTGAIIDRASKWMGLPDVVVDTVCPYCSGGCEIKIEVKDGKIIRSVPKTVKRICDRGRFGIINLIENQYRISYPLVKGNPETYENAFQKIVEIFKKYKPEEIGILLSPQLTNEEIYLACKFAKEILKTDNIEVYGGMDFPLIHGKQNSTEDEILKSDTILVFGNPNPMLSVLIRYSSRMGKNVINITPFSNNGRYQREVILPPNEKILDFLKSEVLDGKGKKLVIVAQEYKEYIFEIYEFSKSWGASFIYYPLFSNSTGAFHILEHFGYSKNWKDVKCLWAIGCQPTNGIYESVIMQNFFYRENGVCPDVFIPTSSFAETDGTILSVSGEFLELRKAFECSYLTDIDVILKLAKLFDTGVEGFRYEKTKDITDEIKNTIKLKKENLYVRKTGHNSKNMYFIENPIYSYRCYDQMMFSKGFKRIKNAKYS